jgi:Kef-type K+ transport system membrane component KefB/predicted transcriptional regulator
MGLCIIAEGSEYLNLVLLVGLAIFFGSVGAGFFGRLHIPQVVGYIFVGIVFGPLLNLLSPQMVLKLESFNLLALGIIGFLIGGELKEDIFKRFGRQVAAILLFEGVTAYLVVLILSFASLCYFYDWQVSLAIAVVFGAICSATDPASSVNVLWEYRSRGPLTTMLTAIVALDDALAMVLYIISVSAAGFLTGHREGTFWGAMLHLFVEIAGSLGLGAGCGFVLRWILKRLEGDERILIFTIAVVILVVGIAMALKLDIILSSMAFGVALVNLLPRRSLKSFELVRSFSPPIYVLFFVINGARLNIHLTGQVALLAVVYIIGSIVGKTSGSYWGAVYSKAVPAIRKYLGFCLYQQGTIAIALLIMASHRFEGEVRDLMLSVIIAGVLVLQLVGPLFVKIGIRKAGEAGLNITEEDLIKTYNVADVMDIKVPVISAGTSLSEVVKVVSSTDSFYYPVVDTDEKLVGVVTLDGIRNTFATQEVNDWLVALDIAEPIVAKVTPEMTLSEALDKTKQLDMEYLPVVDSGAGGRFTGVLDVRAVHRQLGAEVLSRQQRADSAHSVENV